MGRENHENETNAFFDENQKKAKELKTWLFTFSEAQDADNAWTILIIIKIEKNTFRIQKYMFQL